MKKQSLQRRLLAPLLAFVPLIMACTGWIEYSTSSAELNHLMESKGDALVGFLQNTSPTYLTNYDLSALERFVDNTKSDPDVGFAVFYDDKGKPLTQNSKEPEGLRDLRVFERDIMNSNGAKIGSVKIGFRLSSLKKVLSRNLLTVIGGMAFSVLMIFIVVMGASAKIVTMVGNVISQLAKTGSQLGAAAKGVVSSSETLAESSHEQDASVAKSVTALAQLTSMIEKTAVNAKRSSEVAGLSQESVVKGKVTVDDLIKAISAIRESNAALNQQISHNNEQLREVNKIIGVVRDRTMVINDIVFQTKLLSFNASVEAARAGEHGKGFAVVAEEVGKLAAMSGQAAKEIGDLLTESVEKVVFISQDSEKQVNSLLEATHKRHQEGADMAKRCHEVFNDIAGKVKSAFEMANEIAQANQQQSSGVQDIQQAMLELKQQMERNRGISESQAGMAANLSDESATLYNVTTELTALIMGGRAAPGTVTDLPKRTDEASSRAA